MASKRVELAAARAASAALRGQQLRERLARLRAGEWSTPEDVALARASAATQRAEVVRAQERLLRAYAAAAALKRGAAASRVDAPRHGQPGEGMDVPEDASAGRSASVRGPSNPGAGVARSRSKMQGPGVPADDLGIETQTLRRALVSIASSETGAGAWSQDRRQELWRGLVDQCGHESWQGWSHALCQVGKSMLAGIRGIGFSGYDNRQVPHLLAVTDEWTRQAEEIAQMVGEGPAVEAHRSQRPVLVRNLRDEQARWPGYVDAAVSAGVTTICALPVRLNGVGLGSLTLYQDQQEDCQWHPWPDGLFLATVAAKALLADLDAVDDEQSVSATDHQIQVATGVLAVRLGMSVDDAYVRMRAFAFSNARRLSEVAEAVLEGTLSLS